MRASCRGRDLSGTRWERQAACPLRTALRTLDKESLLLTVDEIRCLCSSAFLGLCPLLVLADALHHIDHPRGVSAKNTGIFYRTLTLAVAAPAEKVVEALAVTQHVERIVQARLPPACDRCVAHVRGAIGRGLHPLPRGVLMTEPHLDRKSVV